MTKAQLKKKIDRLEISTIILSIICVIMIFIIILSVDVISDLTATANGYKSDRNICRKLAK